MDSGDQGPGITALHRNPFHVLGASLDSTRQDIAELAAGRSLLGDEATVQVARSALIRPQSRLAAEIGWLPGLPPEVIQQLVEFNRFDSDILQHVDASSLTLANAYAAMLEHRGSNNVVGMVTEQELPRFLRLVDQIDVPNVTSLVNRHRERSAFASVGEDAVAAALQEQRRYYLAVCGTVLGNFGRDSQGSTLAMALTKADRDAHFVHDVVDAFQLRHASAVDEHLAELRKLLERIEQDPYVKGAPFLQWKNRLPHFAKLIGPVLKSRELRGLRHHETEELVWAARDTAVRVANDHAAFETSHSILTSLRDAFVVSPAIQESIADDIEQVEGILRRIRSLQAAQQPAPATPQQQPTGGRPAPVPGPSIPKADRPRKKGGIWKAVAAVVVLLFLANVFSSEADDKSNLSTEPSRTPITRDKCDGVDAWWDATNSRIGRSNLIVDSLTFSSTYSDYLTAQNEIMDIAQKQRFSLPPSVASELNLAQIAMFDFIASDLMDTTTPQYERERRFDELQASIVRERNEIGRQCNFSVVGE